MRQRKRKMLVFPINGPRAYVREHIRTERQRMNRQLRMEILRRDGYTCRNCGMVADRLSQLEVDHINPISRGGRTVRENLQALCVACNRRKGARRMEDA